MRAQEQLLQNLIVQCRTRLQHYGCCDVDNTTLLNDYDLKNVVHPMFTPDRWLAGFEQQTDRFYGRMKPALRLASLFLEEDCVLDHFAHYKFGQRKRNASGSEYIIQQTSPYSSAAKANVRKDFRGLAKCVTFLFCPGSYHDQYDFNKGIPVYGRSYKHKKGIPYYYRYHPQNWPDLDPAQSGQSEPTIVLNSDFVDYLCFPDYQTASLPRFYRTMLVLACTIVHEVAHAYGYYLEEEGEVCWNKYELKPELGYAWEQEVLGCILNPLFDDIIGCPLIVAACFQSYSGLDGQASATKRCVGRNDLYWKRLGSDADNAAWAELLQPQNIRGGKHTRGNYPYCIGALRAIPMHWIVDWFRESFWERRRRQCARDGGMYTPPPIGKTFLLLYKYDNEGGSVFYPLDPAFGKDAQDIREQQQWLRHQG